MNIPSELKYTPNDEWLKVEEIPARWHHRFCPESALGHRLC